jgi:diacylglycerol O-acyltransferase
LHGEKVNGRFLRVVCPVNLRGGEQGESLGNRITLLPVILPLDVRDPVEMLHAVTARMEIMKSVRAAELIAIAASCLGTTPAPVQELFWRGLPLIPLPLPLLNMICTNVPGSPTALYSVGRRLLASYPHVPTGYELGLGVAMQSYDGKFFFGLTADAHVAPDVARLRDFIRLSFDELCKAAAKTARPRSTPPRAARPRPAKRTKPGKPAGPAESAEPAEPAASTNGAAPEEPAPAPPPESATAPLAAAAAAGAEPAHPEPIPMRFV